MALTNTIVYKGFKTQAYAKITNVASKDYMADVKNYNASIEVTTFTDKTKTYDISWQSYFANWFKGEPLRTDCYDYLKTLPDFKWWTDC